MKVEFLEKKLKFHERDSNIENVDLKMGTRIIQKLQKLHKANYGRIFFFQYEIKLINCNLKLKSVKLLQFRLINSCKWSKTNENYKLRK